MKRAEREKGKGSKAQGVKLEEGARLRGEVKSVKNQQLFVQAREESGAFVLGRLLQSECESSKDFESFSKGDVVEVKVLKVSKVTTAKGANPTWMELTRRKAHMDRPDGLDADLRAKSLLTVSDLKVGQVIDSAVVIGSSSESALNLRNSKPLHVQASVNVRG